MNELRGHQNSNLWRCISKIEKGLLLTTGTILIISMHFFLGDEKAFLCQRGIYKIIKRDIDYYKNSAIYLIYNVNLNCRPLLDYHVYKSYYDLRKIILFFPDYSDQDIQNFINVFNIEGLVDIRRMDDEWYSVYLKCNNNKGQVNLNFLILVINGRIAQIKGF